MFQIQVDIVIASFVKNANTVTELRNIMGNQGKKMSIIANIQTNEGYRNFDEILEVCIDRIFLLNLCCDV